MTEPIFELRFQELIGERPVNRQESRSAVIFLQALFDVAGEPEFYQEDEAA